MTTSFFTPLIDIQKSNVFSHAVSCAETYLNFSTHCYRFIDMRADQTIVVVESQLTKEHWFHIILKIASMILSLGIFPLTMFIIKCFYRFHHPLSIDQNPSKANSLLSAIEIPPLSVKLLPPSSLESHPTVILHKIFTDFFTPSKLLQNVILNKHFDRVINNDFMKWNSLYEKITKGMDQQELKAFIHRIKIQYTQGREPSYKQKVHYLCRELWEDAKQIPNIQQIIQKEKLTMGDLMVKEQYDRFKALIQPIQNQSLLGMMKGLFQKNKLLLKNFKEFLSNKNNDHSENKIIMHFREWFTSNEINLDLIKSTTTLDLKASIKILSKEMLGYMMLMINLEELDLSDNGISALPESIGNLHQLKRLDLSYNKFSILPEAIGNLCQLQVLSLKENQISTLPKFFENLHQLTSLNLSYNDFSILPESIKNLRQLQKLDLASNKISILSKSIGDLCQLQELHLDQNNFSTLPDIIGSLNKLKILTLYKNKISVLPEFIGKLNQLEKLDLSINKLSTLPKSIGKLNRLEELFVYGNNFGFFGGIKAKKLLKKTQANKRKATVKDPDCSLHHRSYSKSSSL